MKVEWPSTAFIDETQDEGWYLLAAVVVEDRVHVMVRDTTIRLRKGAPKVHWWLESDARRVVLTDHLRSVGGKHLVVVRSRLADEKDERSRRKCLDALFVALEAAGVDHAVFEARERRQNERDRAALDFLRRSKRLRGQLKIDHRPGPTEPLLWLADILAGVVRTDRAGDTTYSDMLGEVETLDV